MKKTTPGFLPGMLALSAVMLAAAVYADADMDDDRANPAPSVPMISGGVGEEMDYLNSVQNQYDLKLVFAEANGIYLAEVPVIIQDEQGHKVVDTVTKGPILLVTLPPGSYKVTATRTSDAEIKTQKVFVSNKKPMREYVIRFRATDDKVD